MFRALIPGTDFAPQTACRQPFPTGTARKQTAPQNHDNHQKTIHTHAFTGASRRIRRLRGVQFGRRRPEPPKPSGYDIYTAGYTTPASKAVATVWKNGQLLYTLTDGTNDAWAYAVCVSDGTVYAAGYERQGDRIVAKVWENGTLKYTPGAPGADSYAYSVFAANGSLYTAGSEESGGALTAKIWKDGDALYAYSVSPAVSQARSVCVSGGDVYAAGSLQSGLTKPLAVVWKNDKAHYTLSDGETPPE